MIEMARIVIGMVPMMKSRTSQQLLKKTKAESNIGMNEIAPNGTDEDIVESNRAAKRGNGLSDTDDIDQRYSCQLRHHNINWIGPSVHQPIHRFSTMVNPVDSPEQRNAVAPTMAEVATKIGRAHV